MREPSAAARTPRCRGTSPAAGAPTVLALDLHEAVDLATDEAPPKRICAAVHDATSVTRRAGQLLAADELEIGVLEAAHVVLSRRAPRSCRSRLSARPPMKAILSQSCSASSR